MNHLLNNRVGKRPQTQRRGCLFLILGTILALLATGAYALGILLLTHVYIEARHGDEAGYAIMTIVMGSIVVAMLLFYAILTLWYISPTQDEVDRENRRMANSPGGHNREPAKALSRRKLWLITGGLLFGVVVCGFVSLNTYQFVTEEGVRTYFFGETSRYEWNDVRTYGMECDMEHGISISLIMKDGKEVDILPGGKTNSATDLFVGQYSSPTQFAATVDERLRKPNDGSPALLRHDGKNLKQQAETFYRGAYPELWPYVAKMIGFEDIQPSGDKFPAESLPESSAESTGDTRS